jgi:hypothetical protein
MSLVESFQALVPNRPADRERRFAESGITLEHDVTIGRIYLIEYC